MKEKLYTIELTDAVKAEDECMFCWLERKLEQENLEFVLGSSYMENDIREQTSRKGFCRHHTKMMFDYGNTLGNAWILKSRMEYVNREFAKQIGETGKESRAKGGFSGLFKKRETARAEGAAHSCYICDRMQVIYDRMLDTFVYMLRNDPAFCDQLMASKGFCMHHFADVQRVCGETLKQDELAEWMPKLKELMTRNLDRIQEDIDWLIEKFDYRNQDADWKNSRDAVQRTMQKLVGGHPADPVFQNRK